MVCVELLMAQQHQAELIREAQHEQLMHEAHQAQADEHKPAFIPALAWMGHRMMHLGESLVALAGEQRPERSLN